MGNTGAKNVKEISHFRKKGQHYLRCSSNPFNVFGCLLKRCPNLLTLATCFFGVLNRFRIYVIAEDLSGAAAFVVVDPEVENIIEKSVFDVLIDQSQVER